MILKIMGRGFLRHADTRPRHRRKAFHDFSVAFHDFSVAFHDFSVAFHDFQLLRPALLLRAS